MGYYSDVSPLYNEEDGFDECHADNGVLSACAVNKGDRVMIQSKITGEFDTYVKCAQSDACSILMSRGVPLTLSENHLCFTSWLAFVSISFSFLSSGIGLLVLSSLQSKIKGVLNDVFCPYFSPKVKVKLTRRTRGYFMTRISTGESW